MNGLQLLRYVEIIAGVITGSLGLVTGFIAAYYRSEIVIAEKKKIADRIAKMLG